MASQLALIDIPEDPEISTLMENFTHARQELDRSRASDDRVGEVLAAGRVMAILLEGVVQDCSGCDGTGLTLVMDKQLDCPDCAPVRQAIHDWAIACGSYHAGREAEGELATVRLPKKQLDALISHHWHAGYPSPSSGPFSAWHREVYEALSGREWTEKKPGAEPVAARLVPDQPHPKPGDGRDVILDLLQGLPMRHLIREAQRVSSRRIMVLEAATIVAGICDELGLDLRTVMQERRSVGIARYGTTLQPHNGRQALLDALQEACDCAIYLHQAEMEQAAPSPRAQAASQWRKSVGEEGQAAGSAGGTAMDAYQGTVACCDLSDEELDRR